jgi:hypothetical protein
MRTTPTGIAPHLIPNCRSRKAAGTALCNLPPHGSQLLYCHNKQQLWLVCVRTCIWMYVYRDVHAQQDCPCQHVQRLSNTSTTVQAPTYAQGGARCYGVQA